MYNDDGAKEGTLSLSSTARITDRDRAAYAVFSIGGARETLTRRAPLLAPLLLLHRPDRVSSRVLHARMLSD